MGNTVSVPLLDVISRAASFLYYVMGVGFDIGGFTITLGGAFIFVLLLGVVLFVGRILIQ